MNFRSLESDKRFEFVLARDLKRTHAELMHGISNVEYIWWQALYELEGEEREKEREDNKRQQRRKR